MNSFFFHTEEIKYRCIYMVITFVSLFITSCITIYPILFYMTKPLKIVVNVNVMITDLLEFWVVAISLAGFLSFFLSFPNFLYSFWAFIVSSLYPKEKKFFNKLLRLSFALFVIGNTVCFYYLLPFIISYCFQQNQTVGFLNLEYMPKLATYISFLYYFLFLSFCFFQFPVLFVALIEMNLLTHRKLSNHRKVIYICFLLISALLSPPDIISEILLALFLSLIMEILIFYSCIYSKLQNFK